MNFCAMCGAALTSQMIDDKVRLACSNNCGYVHWNNPTPVVAGLVKVAPDQYMLAQNAAWPQGLFSVISGFLESGETPEASIKRELHEELGLSSSKVFFLGHYPFFKMNQIILGYLIEAYGEIKLSSEIAAVKTLSSSQLNDYDFGPLKLAQAMVKDWQTSNNLNS